MAVQDDNTILKKADLKAYHQQIAGQLGGTFALRTNNSDFFSTDEKVMGVWKDGRPLYQKTCVYERVGGVLTANSWASLNVSGLPTDIETQVEMQVSTGVSTLPIAAGVHNGAISYYSNAPYGYDVLYFTITYTKTTDQPNSAINSGAYDINFPNTWPANTEIYLGNGVYGYRATGTTNVSTSKTNITLANIGGSVYIQNWGGTMKRSVVSTSAGNVALPSSDEYIKILMVASPAGVVMLQYSDNATINNVPYDIWFVYHKGGN